VYDQGKIQLTLDSNTLTQAKITIKESRRPVIFLKMSLEVSFTRDLLFLKLKESKHYQAWKNGRAGSIRPSILDTKLQVSLTSWNHRKVIQVSWVVFLYESSFKTHKINIGKKSDLSHWQDSNRTPR